MTARDWTGDRACDAGRRPHDAAAKPPVLRRATLRVWCAACLALIVYGTLGPLGGGGHPWIVAPAVWRWLPKCRAIDLNDLLTNLAVYVPVGISLRLLVRRRGHAGRLDFALGLILAAGLSYITEVLQQALPARSSNLLDVAVNTFAALVGCWVAAPVQDAIRGLHAFAFARVQAPWRPWSLMAWLSAAAATVLMTLPWNLTRPRAVLGFDQPLDGEDLRRFTLFAVIGFFAVGAALWRGRSALRAASETIAKTALLALTLEAVQAGLRAHVCSLRDAFIAIAGGVAGCAAGLWFVRPTSHSQGRASLPASRGSAGAAPSHCTLDHCPSRSGNGAYRKLAGSALAATLIYAAGTALWRAPRLPTVRGEPLVHWTLFQAHFSRSFAHMTADIAEQVALSAFITLLCLMLTNGRGRMAALLLVLGLTGTLETARAFVAAQGADATALLLAAAGWLLTQRVWRALYPSGGPTGAPAPERIRPFPGV